MIASSVEVPFNGRCRSAAEADAFPETWAGFRRTFSSRFSTDFEGGLY